MKFFGLEISTASELDMQQIIIQDGKERLTISIDPAGKDDPYYILSRIDSRGHISVVQHGEITTKAGKKGESKWSK